MCTGERVPVCVFMACVHDCVCGGVLLCVCTSCLCTHTVELCWECTWQCASVCMSVCVCVCVCVHAHAVVGMYLAVCTHARVCMSVCVCARACACPRGGILMGTHVAACARVSVRVRVWSAHAPVAPRCEAEDAGAAPSSLDVIASASRVWQETQN